MFVTRSELKIDNNEEYNNIIIVTIKPIHSLNSFSINMTTNFINQ